MMLQQHKAGRVGGDFVVVVFFLFVFVVVSNCFTFIKPPRVQPGDTVGFISPASPPYYIYNATQYQPHVISTMSQLGLNVIFGANAFDEWGYLAGNDTQRASDLMTMFQDPTVTMIVANRGGYGCSRIIDKLDYDIIAENPKVFMGYSDLTACLNAITTKTGLITFHGPMGIDTWFGGNSSLNGEYVQNVTMFGQEMNYTNLPMYQTVTINPGKARGTLIGGNLSVFTAIIGSQYLFLNHTVGAILFLEDVNEAVYQIDRMLTQLHLGGYFDNLAGFVFGRCTDCTAGNESLTLLQVLQQKIQPLGIPAFEGAMFGHDLYAQFTLPIGLMAEIDADAGTISLLEPAVVTN